MPANPHAILTPRQGRPRRKTHATEAMHKMPYKDPSNWNQLLVALLAIWDSMPEWARLLVLSIPLQIARAVRSHKRPWRDALLESAAGALLVAAVAYGVKLADLPEWITFAAIGALVGLGFNPTIDIAKDLYQRVVDRFLPKKD